MKNECSVCWGDGEIEVDDFGNAVKCEHCNGTGKKLKPSQKQQLYKDTIHGFEARASSRNGAWMLIRVKCWELKLQVPTYDKIQKVK